MKKLFACLAVFSLVVMQGIPVFAAERELTPYSVDATTYPITDAVQMASQISGDVRIHHIIISASDIAVAQTISFYGLSDSTTTVVEKFVVRLPSTSASGFVVPLQISFPIPASPLMIHDLCVRKTSLVSEVQVTIFYR